MIFKGLLTEREVCMGKYQTEVLAVRTERSEVCASRPRSDIPHTDEQARLIIYLLYGFEETYENSPQTQTFLFIRDSGPDMAKYRIYYII